MVNILIVTHNKIGAEILKTAETILGKCIPSVQTISIPGNLKPEKLGLFADEIRLTIESLEKADGVLILTDIYGATPSNLVHYFTCSHHVKILSGLNLPMLIRILNYAEQPLDLLAKIGIVGANKGITKEIGL